MANNRLPPRHRKRATIESLPADQKGHVEAFISGEDGLLLTGPAGTGKTHVAIVALIEYLVSAVTETAIREADRAWKPPTYEFTTVPELLMEIRGTFKDSAPASESDLIYRYADRDVLILDDLGVEKVTDWSLQTLYLIIDRRYNAEKKTIITTNLTLDEIADKIGDRIASRIAGMCRIVEIKGKDRRLSR